MRSAFQYSFILFAWLHVYDCGQLAAHEDLRSHLVLGANNLPLNVIESGSRGNKAFLFIHGSGQGAISWKKQLQSSLQYDFHLVAFDLRGHGSSGKPRFIEDYDRACIWAEDIQRIMDSTGLERPVLVGWSKGGLMVMHYIACFGVDSIAGIVLVSSQAKLVDVSPSFGLEMAKASQKQLRSRDINTVLLGAKNFTSLLTSRPINDSWNLVSRSMNVMLPPYVRSAMQNQVISSNGEVIESYSNLFHNIALPVLIILGAKDPFRNAEAMALAYKELIPWSRISIYEKAGHSPFLEEPDLFNKDIKNFSYSLYSRVKNRN